MKKVGMMMAALLVAVGLSSCEKETKLSTDDFPSEITEYASEHFPERSIVQIIKDSDGLDKDYEVYLKGGVYLEFDKKKKIQEIESPTALPASVVPDNIESYVAANYPDNFITGWELDDKNQQVTLNSGLELEFDMNGKFLRID